LVDDRELNRSVQVILEECLVRLKGFEPLTF